MKKNQFIRLKKIPIFVIFLFSLIYISSSRNLHAADYYVAANGNDSNPGSESLPWLTVQKAANTLVAGDTVYIKAGTYNEIVTPVNSGSSGNYITYTNYSNATVTIDGTSLSVSANSGLISMNSKDYIKVIGLRITNAGSDNNSNGIYIYDCNYITIQDNYTYNTTSSGIGVWNSSNITVDNNEVELACNDGEQECITIATTNDFEVKNNVVHDNGAGTIGGEGIDAKDGAYNGSIHGNTVYDLNNRLGIYIEAWDKHTYNIDVYQNVVYNITNASGFTVASEEGGLLENINIYNNIAYGCGETGISFTRSGGAATHPLKDITVINNTFYNNGAGAWGGGIAIDNIDLTNAVIRNNIVSQNLSFQIEVETDVPASSYTIDYNLIDGYRGYDEETYGTNYQTGDPLFVSAAQGDFSIQSGSPAIDNASATSAPGTDYNGTSRPQDSGYDIGAYEYRPNTIWYLAEGSTSGYDTWICVQNPSPTAATDVTLTFMDTTGSTTAVTQNLAANSRMSYRINDNTSMSNKQGVSTKVESSGSVGVIAERVMYWPEGISTNKTGGHCSIGTTNPGTTWYLAEGSTSGYDTWICVQNPSPATATDITLTFMDTTGGTATVTQNLAAKSRMSYRVNDNATMNNKDGVSTKVESSGGVSVIAERVMYWPEGISTSKTGGHCSIGTTNPGTTWYLAEGSTSGYDTWICVQNPSPATATDITLTFMDTTGGTATVTQNLAANSRMSYRVNDNATMNNKDGVSTKVESSGAVSVIAERVMYWPEGISTSKTGGHCSIGRYE